MAEENKKIKEGKKEETEEKKIVEPLKKDSETEEKKEVKKKEEKPKKTEASAKGMHLPISTKHSIAICKFIMGKGIGNAVNELEKIYAQKKALPMKGEIPHRRGKGMMSGRYPKKAIQHFVILLKNVSANANASGMNDPIITEAIANMASRPYGKFGKIRKKRTNVIIKVKEKKSNKKEKGEKE
ncbi:MAG: hypothetical protein KKA64_01670 [Nanoarchaeota archaeon]|nr:hypothetical protein [Nanoarchaeota archaeon]